MIMSPNWVICGPAQSPALVTGHRTRSIFDRYSIVGGRQIQDAAGRLGKRLKRSLDTILGTVDAAEAEEDDAGRREERDKPLDE